MRKLFDPTENLEDFKQAKGRTGVALIALLMLVVLPVLHPTRAIAGDADARLFAAHALALRASAIEGEPKSWQILAGMPGSVPKNALPLLWRPFFENTIVKLGRLRSTAPLALYYNPLLDVAVFTLWEKREAHFTIVSLRALPGERMSDPRAGAPLRPKWMEAEDGLILALPRITKSRLISFQRTHPAEAQTGGYDEVTFAKAAIDLRAALPRLMWNTVQREQWTTKSFSWLLPALTGIEEALATGDAAAIKKSAPETDPATAEAIADLPPEFISRLTLDMVLEAGDAEHLLIGSLADDGDFYILITCRLDGDTCAPRQYILFSL